MKRKPPAAAPHDPPPVVQDPPTGEASDDRLARIAARPDGFHWLAADGKQEFGPFESLDAALADMDGSDDETIEPGESLAEAEQELGLTEWIDPDTGQQAEQTVTRIDDEH